MGVEADKYNSIVEQETTLLALIEDRSKGVETLRQRVSYYQKQLVEAEKRLQDSQSDLALLRSRHIPASSNASSATEREREEPTTVSPKHKYRGSGNQRKVKTEPLFPSVNPKISAPVNLEETATSYRGVKVKAEEANTSSTTDRGTKRKFAQEEHKELKSSVKRRLSATTFSSFSSNFIPSQHKRKLKSVVVCPKNDQLFVTCALDGLVNFWQVQGSGSSASLLYTADCVSSGERRWPEDMAWHPNGSSLFFVYTADKDDSQILVLNLNESRERPRGIYMEDKPHVKGIINCIEFMPWEYTCFVTGGSDHAVVLWNERDENVWKPKTLHKSLHSSSVMGVAGMQKKQYVLSAGLDKRIFCFDVLAESVVFGHQVDGKCMSVLPNPCDFNLFMIQSGVHERQLRLYDIRSKAEVHSFGWKQDSSESHSALISQAWSPDGLYLSSGSTDPVIHIFDIRYKACKPSQSIQAHSKRVFKAAWHYSLPLLISISSDLQIGLHKYFR